MTTAPADPVFIDTSVLVYSTVTSAPLHKEAFQKLDELRRAGVDLWISRQVLREYMAVLTRPQTYTMPLPAAVVAADVAHFQTAFRIAEDGSLVTTNLLSLLTTVSFGGKQVHDANIAATMLAHGLTRLLTANPGDFSRFGSHIIVISLVP